MAGKDNAKTTREAAAEILALRLFRQTDGGPPITRRMVEEQMRSWQSHPDGCECGVCELAHMVSVSRVWCCAWGWQASIARTRRLARS